MIGDNVEKVGWEVVGEIIDKSKEEEEDEDDNKGHQKRHSNRGGK
jgi:hypothetical protein